MIIRITAYILVCIGVVSITFFGIFDILENSFIYWILGFVFVLAGWIMLRLTPTVKETKLSKLIKELKLNGERITVDFSKCEIKSNTYTELNPQYQGRDELLVSTLDLESEIKVWNTIKGEVNQNSNSTNVYQSVLVFKNPYRANETFISEIIPKDKTSLIFLLEDKKETTLYVDKNDRVQYYFDLEFLII